MKKNNKEPEINKSDFEQKTRVLLEDIRHSVQTIGEGHSGIINRLDKIESEMSSVKSEMSSVKSELQYVKTAVIDINQTVKSIEKKLDNHETRISKIEEKVHV